MDASVKPERGWRRALPSSRRGRLLVALAVVAVIVTIAVGLMTLNNARTATSAELGREGTRTFEGTPDDLPPNVVPENATEVEGTVARRGDNWSSAVTFVVAGDREDVMPIVDEAVKADGYVLRQRAYDDSTMQVIYDGEDGSVLTVTYQSIPEGTGTAVVLVSP